MQNLFKKSLLTILSTEILFSLNLMAIDNQSFEKLKVITDIKGDVALHVCFYNLSSHSNGESIPWPMIK